MRRTKRTRLEAVGCEIEALPIRRDVVAPAFERFRASGELPNHRQLAIDVIRWAEVGSANVRKHGGSLFIAEEYNRAYALIDDPDAWRRPKPLRYYLFREAIGSHPIEPIAARSAIRAIAELGGDVEDPDFVCPSVGEPEFVSVGMHLLGFPERYFRGGYEEQGQRLMDRVRPHRARLTVLGEEWRDRSLEAQARFVTTGELPEDELLREMALGYGEWFALKANWLGHGDSELLAAYDRVGRGVGRDRDTTIPLLQEAVRSFIRCRSPLRDQVGRSGQSQRTSGGV